jgi:hypothetical protein
MARKPLYKVCNGRARVLWDVPLRQVRTGMTEEEAVRDEAHTERHDPSTSGKSVRFETLMELGICRLAKFVDDAVQLLCQSLRGLVELNEAACLKVDIHSFQVVTDRLAKLVGCPNSLTDQQ